MFFRSFTKKHSSFKKKASHARTGLVRDNLGVKIVFLEAAYRQLLQIRHTKKLPPLSELFLIGKNNYDHKPPSPKNYFWIGGLIFIGFIFYFYYQQQEDNKDASALENFADMIDEKWSLGFLKGDFNQTIFYLSAIALKYPETGLPQAVQHLEDSQFQQAIAAFDHIFINQFQQKSAYLLIKAIIALSIDQYAKATVFLEESLKANPSLWLKEHIYAHLLVALDKQEEKLKIQQIKSYLITERINIAAQNYPYIKLKNLIKSQYHPGRIDKSAERRVVIRIWCPMVLLDDVGHVSIETSKHHISFWPSDSKNNYAQEITKRGRHFHTFLEDIRAEKRLPDYKIVLYTLKNEVINETFEEFKLSNFNWTIFGSTPYRNQNCAGLVRHLLRNALPEDGWWTGLSHMANFKRSMFFSLLTYLTPLSPVTMLTFFFSQETVSPENIASIVLCLNQFEMSDYLKEVIHKIFQLNLDYATHIYKIGSTFKEFKEGYQNSITPTGNLFLDVPNRISFYLNQIHQMKELSNEIILFLDNSLLIIQDLKKLEEELVETEERIRKYLLDERNALAFTAKNIFQTSNLKSPNFFSTVGEEITQDFKNIKIQTLAGVEKEEKRLLQMVNEEQIKQSVCESIFLYNHS